MSIRKIDNEDLFLKEFFRNSPMERGQLLKTKLMNIESNGIKDDIYGLEDKEDIINKPNHYHKNQIDVIGYLEQHFAAEPGVTVAEGFYIGNVIKYVSRYKEKNGINDLKKAQFYLSKLIKFEE